MASRIETHIETHTDSYDWITSRAFANLQTFADMAMPYLTESGHLLAMKARLPEVSHLKMDFVAKNSDGQSIDHTDVKIDAKTDMMLSETAEQYAQLSQNWRIKLIELDVPYLDEPRHLVTMQSY